MYIYVHISPPAVSLRISSGRLVGVYVQKPGEHRIRVDCEVGLTLRAKASRVGFLKTVSVISSSSPSSEEEDSLHGPLESDMMALLTCSALFLSFDEVDCISSSAAAAALGLDAPTNGSRVSISRVVVVVPPLDVAGVPPIRSSSSIPKSEPVAGSALLISLATLGGGGAAPPLGSGAGGFVRATPPILGEKLSRSSMSGRRVDAGGRRGLPGGEEAEEARLGGPEKGK